MDRRLIQSYYSFDLDDKEMGKLRRLRGIHVLVNKITRRPQVKGVIFTDTSIEVNIEAGEHEIQEEVEDVEAIINEELI